MMWKWLKLIVGTLRSGFRGRREPAREHLVLD